MVSPAAERLNVFINGISPVELTATSSAFHHVAGIVRCRSEAQMGRIATRRHITRMEHEKTAGDWPIGEFPSDPMRFPRWEAVSSCQLSVAETSGRCLPNPTIIGAGGGDFAPESQGQWGDCGDRQRIAAVSPVSVVNIAPLPCMRASFTTINRAYGIRLCSHSEPPFRCHADGRISAASAPHYKEFQW